MRMRNLLPLAGMLMLGHLATAQVKIGDNPQNIDPASLLELESSDRVLVITRVSTTQMNAINPSLGAIVYNTDAQCLFYYDGTEWRNICESLPVEFTAEAIVNVAPTIVITETGDQVNFEVGEIRGTNILDFSIGSQDIQNNSINSDKLAPNSVGTEELQDNTITDAELDYAAVTLADFTNDAGFITAANLVSGDPGNDLTAGADNGVYFDAESLEVMIFDNADDIAANAAAIAADGDTDSSNELQFLGLTANVLSISGGNTVDLSGFNNAGTDDQNLTLAGNTLSIESGNSVSLAPFLDDTDQQTLSLAGNNLNISNGNSVDLSGLTGIGGTTEVADGVTIAGDGSGADPFRVADGGIGTTQLADLAVTTAKINNTAVTAGKIANNAVTTAKINNLAVTTGKINDLAITAGKIANTAVTPAKIQPSATDGQVLTTVAGAAQWADPAGGGNPTDELVQSFQVNGVNLELTDAGNVFQVPVNSLGTDDQTAGEVGFTPYLSLAGPSTQLAIQELKDELDASVISGGGNPLDELQDLQLSGDILTLTNPATPGNQVDLSGIGGGTDDQNIQGSGLAGETLTIGIEGGNPENVDLSAFALDADITAAIATSEAADGDTDSNNEIELPAGGNNGDLLSTNGSGTYSWVPSIDTDDQNIQGSGLAGETLTIGIEGGNPENVDLSTFALDADVIAAIAASDAADGDTDSNNEIELPAGGNNGDVLSTDGAGTYSWIVPGGTDDQNIQGSGLAGETLTIGIEGGNPQNVDLSSFALDTDVTAAIAASDAADGDTDSNNEIELPAGGNNGDVLSTDGAGTYSWIIPGGTDDQNIQGSGLAGETLTIGIEGGNPQDVDLSSFALDTDVTAAIAVSDAADGDTDSNNEIEIPAGGNNGDVLSTDGAGTYNWVSSTSTDDQNIQGSGLAGETLTIGIEGGNPQNVDLSSFALDTDVTAAIAASDAADGDTDSNNEIELPAGGNNGDVLSTDGAGTYNWIASGGTDDQNIQGSGLAGETLTIGIEGGNPQNVDLSSFALDTDVTAAIAASDAADGDTDSNNEIELPGGGNNGDVLSTDGTGTYSWVSSTSTDDQNIQGSGLAGETLTIGIEGGNPQNVDLSSFALDTDVTAAIAASEAADGDTDSNNEIELPAGGNNGDVLSTDGAGNYSWVTNGGLPVSSFGAVYFSDGGGGAQTNPSNFVWDDTALGGNGALGIGVTTPTSKVQVIGQVQASSLSSSSNGLESNPAFRFGNDPNSGMFLASIGELAFSSLGIEALRIDGSQNVGIGLTNPLEKLHVFGNIRADGNFISANTTIQTPDYVFQRYFLGSSTLDPDYRMPSLEEVRAYVRENHHLPGVTSAAEVAEQGGIILNEATTQNLEKIEELFLHTIEQEEKIEALQAENTDLQQELEDMKMRMARIEALLNQNPGK